MRLALTRLQAGTTIAASAPLLVKKSRLWGYTYRKVSAFLGYGTLNPFQTGSNRGLLQLFHPVKLRMTALPTACCRTSTSENGWNILPIILVKQGFGILFKEIWPIFFQPIERPKQTNR